jgi:hypothetical protein
MFEVTKFEPPEIFVTCRRTGETFSFLVQNNGALAQGARFDQGDARHAATAYLAWFSKARQGMAVYRSTSGSTFGGK